MFEFCVSYLTAFPNSELSVLVCQALGARYTYSVFSHVLTDELVEL